MTSALMPASRCRLYAPPNTADTETDRWRHQSDAAGAFFKAKCGILEMATGTGKTLVRGYRGDPGDVARGGRGEAHGIAPAVA